MMEDAQCPEISLHDVFPYVRGACPPVYIWIAKFFQDPYLSKKLNSPLKSSFREGTVTIAEDAMELIFGKEGKPIYTFLLILAKLCFDTDWERVLFYLASIE